MKRPISDLLDQTTLNHFDTFFKEKYLYLLNHKKEHSFHSLLKECLDHFGVQEEQVQQAELLKWYNDIVEQKFIKDIIEESVHEIILHSPSEIQLISPCSRKNISTSVDQGDYQLSLETLASQAAQDWSYNNPFASFPYKLDDHEFRITLIHQCLSPDGVSKAFLRKVHTSLQRLSDLKLPLDQKEFLQAIVKEKKNTLISGSTGSGKTTLLKAMIHETSEEEHLIILEDCHEIQLNRPHTTHFVSDHAHPQKNLSQYCAHAMRLRPDRIILGEMRGAETAPFILSMNTGHKGLMTTLHANNALECISRISTLFGLYSERDFLSQERLSQLVCQNIDYIIHMEDRKIVEIIQLKGWENETPYYEDCLSMAS